MSERTMAALSDEEIQVLIEDSESDAWDDSVAEWEAERAQLDAEWEAERAQLDAEGRAARVAQWQREEPAVTCEQLPPALLSTQATVALDGLGERIVRTGTIPSHRLHVWALAWMRRVNAIEHNGAIEDGGSLWHRSRNGWLRLNEWGMSLRVPPGEVIAIAAAREIPELTADERRREHDDLRVRMERARRQREARRRREDELEAREGRMWGFGQAEVL